MPVTTRISNNNYHFGWFLKSYPQKSEKMIITRKNNNRPPRHTYDISDISPTDPPGLMYNKHAPKAGITMGFRKMCSSKYSVTYPYCPSTKNKFTCHWHFFSSTHFLEWTHCSHGGKHWKEAILLDTLKLWPFQCCKTLQKIGVWISPFSQTSEFFGTNSAARSTETGKMCP